MQFYRQLKSTKVAKSPLILVGKVGMPGFVSHVVPASVPRTIILRPPSAIYGKMSILPNNAVRTLDLLLSSATAITGGRLNHK